MIFKKQTVDAGTRIKIVDEITWLIKREEDINEETVNKGNTDSYLCHF